MESASNLFNRLRKKAEAQAAERTTFFSNENLLKLKQGKEYKLRLLWVSPPNGFNREHPMIKQYVHRIWDDNAIGSKNVEVYCKTSSYDEGETKAGWECPICKEMSACYKKYSDTGSKSAKEIYDRFRRTFRGYVPVYVISGPDDDQGKIKILQFTKSFNDFFDLKIFGIRKDDNKSTILSEDDILGIDAFTYYDPKDNTIQTKAYDLNITVGTKNVNINGKMVKVPDYSFDFSRKMTEVDLGWDDLSIDRYLNLSDEIGFDRDFLKISTTEELNAFKEKYITNEGATEPTVEEVEDEIPSKVKKMNEISKASSKLDVDKDKDEAPKSEEIETVITEEETDISSDDEDEAENTNHSTDDDEEVDIDSLLEGL